ncbi:GNAT family N-acetyltransferase [Chitinophaga nivalis]|uniref:GNAT family N-acetyltransferase n=1 Tax=Chitinophaga nivalis TaxID=2991709 RepID=A0ABT3IMR7_9BACT|nr:GNAT family N-acetyltransferase [Chitinophaga nivalis]MCW3465047.1 GNAT family N-acetyltransferase [Chitinophaga nivalis]MCW3485261.1 GNAT family N-acetyltransferase [Chitinophaga nivalis]
MTTAGEIILEPLTIADAAGFYALYTVREKEATVSPFLPEETPAAFTQRIIALCAYIFTIRLAAQPDVMIGDCALHDWNEQTGEIEIGGSLFPEYRGKGYMQAAFGLLETLAQQHFPVKRILGKTTPENRNAVRLVEKLGFVQVSADDTTVVMGKTL